MWIIRIIILLIVFAIALGFSIYNAPQRIAQIDVIWVSYSDVSMVIVVYWAFLVGMAVAALLALTYVLKIHSDMRGERRGRKRLEMEVASLRNRSLEELDEL
ncbi:MAG: hypothetical protein AB1792_01840 [Candidatus Zixiibacteriota bacterium]